MDEYLKLLNNFKHPQPSNKNDIKSLKGARDKLTPIVDNIILSLLDLLEKGQNKENNNYLLSAQQYEDVVAASKILQKLEYNTEFANNLPVNTNFVVNTVTLQRKGPIVVDEDTVVELLELYDKLGIILRKLAEGAPSDRRLSHFKSDNDNHNESFYSAHSESKYFDSDLSPDRKKSNLDQEIDEVPTAERKRSTLSNIIENMDEIPEERKRTLSNIIENHHGSPSEHFDETDTDEEATIFIKIRCCTTDCEDFEDDGHISAISCAEKCPEDQHIKLDGKPITLKINKDKVSKGGVYCINASDESSKNIRIVIKECPECKSTVIASTTKIKNRNESYESITLHGKALDETDLSLEEELEEFSPASSSSEEKAYCGCCPGKITINVSRPFCPDTKPCSCTDCCIEEKKPENKMDLYLDTENVDKSSVKIRDSEDSPKSVSFEDFDQRGSVGESFRDHRDSIAPQRIRSSSPPRESIGTHRENVSPPRESIASHRESGYPPRESIGTHRESGYPPRESIGSHRESVAPPRESIGTHRESGYPPRESIVSHRENGYPPRESIVSHRENVSPPRESIGTHRESGYPPRESIVSHRENVSPPRESIVSHRENGYPPRESIVSHRESVSPPGESIAALRQSIISHRESFSSRKESFVPNRKSIADNVEKILPRRQSIALLTRTKVCPSMELDISTVATRLRNEGIQHPNHRIVLELEKLGVDQLLAACKPAACCRKAILNEKDKKALPYCVSLRSLPLIEDDVEVIKQSINMSEKKITHSPDITQNKNFLAYYISLGENDFKPKNFPWVAPVYDLKHFKDNKFFRFLNNVPLDRPLKSLTNLVKILKEPNEPIKREKTFVVKKEETKPANKQCRREKSFVLCKWKTSKFLCQKRIPKKTNFLRSGDSRSISSFANMLRVYLEHMHLKREISAKMSCVELCKTRNLKSYRSAPNIYEKCSTLVKKSKSLQRFEIEQKTKIKLEYYIDLVNGDLVWSNKYPFKTQAYYNVVDKSEKIPNKYKNIATSSANQQSKSSLSTISEITEAHFELLRKGMNERNRRKCERPKSPRKRRRRNESIESKHNESYTKKSLGTVSEIKEVYMELLRKKIDDNKIQKTTDGQIITIKEKPSLTLIEEKRERSKSARKRNYSPKRADSTIKNQTNGRRKSGTFSGSSLEPESDFEDWGPFTASQSSLPPAEEETIQKVDITKTELKSKKKDEELIQSEENNNSNKRSEAMKNLKDDDEKQEEISSRKHNEKNNKTEENKCLGNSDCARKHCKSCSVRMRYKKPTNKQEEAKEHVIQESSKDKLCKDFDKKQKNTEEIKEIAIAIKTKKNEVIEIFKNSKLVPQKGDEERKERKKKYTVKGNDIIAIYINDQKICLNGKCMKKNKVESS